MLNTTKPATVSIILSIILLLLLGALTMFIQMVMLNGVMNEGQATTALGVTLGCQGIAILLGGICAGWLTRLLIRRFGWNSTPAVIATVFLTTSLGAAAGMFSIISGLIAAGI